MSYNIKNFKVCFKIAYFIEIFLLITFLNARAQSTNLFFEPEPIRSFPTNGTAWDIAVGDFNLDGLEDIATANLTYSTVTLLLNETDGEKLYFSKPHIIEVGLWPSTIVAGDFDQDGKIDIITANEEDENLTILHNISEEGEIKFERNDNYETGKRPSSMIAVDFDLDGKLDLIFCNYWGDSIQVFKNISEIDTIMFDEVLKIPVGHFVEEIISDDFNGDGKFDFAYSKYGYFQIFKNVSSSGKIAFSPPIEFVGDDPPLISADFNNDGKPDIGSYDIVWGMTLRKNNSTVNKIDFESYWNFDVGPYHINKAITCDVNNDNKLDIITVSSWVLFAQPRSHNCISVTLNKSTSDNFKFGEYQIIGVADDPICATSFDFNEDGKTDLAIGSDDAACVSILQNKSNLGESYLNSVSVFPLEFLSYDPLAYDAPYPCYLNGTDFDGDEKIDLVATSWDDNGVTFLKNQSILGNLNFSTAISYKIGEKPHQILVYDFNNDGKDDVIVANRYATKDGNLTHGFVTSLKNQSSVEEFIFIPDSIDIGGNAKSMSFADFNDDTKIDVIICRERIEGYTIMDSVIILVNNSTSNNIILKPTTGLLRNSGNIILTDDFDLDGKIDFATLDTRVHRLKIYHNESVGEEYTFIEHQSLHIGYESSNISSSDFDGDGLIDIVSVNSKDENGCYLFRNNSTNGNIEFVLNIQYSPLRRLSTVSVHDLTLDNKPDLIFQDKNSQITIFENNSITGSFDFSPSFPGAIITGDTKPFIADFDGDGYPDIASPRSDQMEVWILRTSTSPLTSMKNDIVALPSEYYLSQNYPNPFNPITTIKFEIPKPGNVSIKIFDVLGREVKTLVNKYFDIGLHNLIWDGLDNSGNKVSSGLYFYSMETDNFIEVKKAILLK